MIGPQQSQADILRQQLHDNAAYLKIRMSPLWQPLEAVLKNKIDKADKEYHSCTGNETDYRVKQQVYATLKRLLDDFEQAPGRAKWAKGELDKEEVEARKPESRSTVVNTLAPLTTQR